MAMMVLEYQEQISNIFLVSTIILPLTTDDPHTHHPSYNSPVLSSTPQVLTLHHYLDVSFNATVIHHGHLRLMQVVSF